MQMNENLHSKNARMYAICFTENFWISSSVVAKS